MKTRHVNVLIAMAVLALPAARSLAQDAAPPSTTTSLPGIGQVLDAVEKASAARGDEGGKDWSAPVKLAVIFLGLALLPSVLVMMTSFTRIVIVLAFVRRALTTQAIPPNIAIIGLALFLTLFTMSGTFGQINEQALQPYLRDQLPFQDACGKGSDLLKAFMLDQTRPEDLGLFVKMAGLPKPSTAEEVPAHVAIPSFAISEFHRAFDMGCRLFIPFLLVDLVIASILLSAGMMMLPPAIVSLPFKIILFVLVDGWQTLAETLVLSFQ